MTGQGQSLLRRSREDGKPNDKRPRHLGRLFDESSRHLVGFLSSVVPAKAGTHSEWARKTTCVDMTDRTVQMTRLWVSGVGSVWWRKRASSASSSFSVLGRKESKGNHVVCGDLPALFERWHVTHELLEGCQPCGGEIGLAAKKAIP